MKIKLISNMVGLAFLTFTVLVSCDSNDSNSTEGNNEQEGFLIPQTLEGLVIDFTTETAFDPDELGVSTVVFQSDLVFTSNNFFDNPFANLDNVDPNPDPFIYEIIGSNLARITLFTVGDNGGSEPDEEVTLSFNSTNSGTESPFRMRLKI